MKCILCDNQGAKAHSQFDRKAYGVLRGFMYLNCPNCGCGFLDPELRLSEKNEAARYAEHNNTAENLGYVKLLSDFYAFCQPFIAGESCGLNYGSGPNNLFSQILNEKGLRIQDWDVHFAQDSQVLQKTYDFVVLHEVAEHFRDPAVEFATIAKLLRPGGYLFFSSGVFVESVNFKNWRYAEDLTHIIFYAEKTHQWLADKYGFSICARTGKWLALRKEV